MTIEERLENMERELGRVKRRNRWLLGAILLVAGGLIVSAVFETTAFRARAQGAGTAKEIRVNSLVLEDENGKLRALLAASKDGPNLEMYDENGKRRARLSATENPQLALYDENGTPRATLIEMEEGPGLMLWDENGKGRVGLVVTKDGQDLQLFGPDGKVIWSAIR